MGLVETGASMVEELLAEHRAEVAREAAEAAANDE